MLAKARLCKDQLEEPLCLLWLAEATAQSGVAPVAQLPGTEHDRPRPVQCRGITVCDPGTLGDGSMNIID